MVQNKVFIFFAICLVVLGCSVKRNSFKNRTFHKITSDFNTLFNGEEAFKEEVKKLNDAFLDDYSEVLRIEKSPLIKVNDSLLVKEDTFQKMNIFSLVKQKVTKDGANQNESKAQGFDRTIEKSKKAIANHSMSIDGKEYNPIMADAYKLIGETRYFRGQSLPAIEAFEFAKEITNPKKYKKIEELNDWIAKAYHQFGNDTIAQSMFERLTKEYKNKKGLKRSLYDYAQLDLDTEAYDDAHRLVEEAIKIEKNRKMKARLLFISAQLKNIIGKENEALETFTKVRKYKPTEKMELKTFTNYISYSKTILPKEEKKLTKKLNGYLTKILYLQYADEIYYALGLLYQKKNDTITAKEYFAKSLREAPSDPDNKMIVFRYFGEKFYKLENYEMAAKYYDSAYDAARKEKKSVIKVKRDKLKSLDEMVKFIQEKDSVIRMAKLSPEQQKVYFEKHIKGLKIKDSIKNQKEELKKQQAINQSAQQNSFQKNSDSKKWYFYNSQLKILGQEEFKKTWGIRALEDNWRVSSKAKKSALSEFANTLNIMKDATKKVENEKYKLDNYLSKIPKDQAEINKLIIARDSTQLNLGVSYYGFFKNVKKADQSLNNLIEKNPLDEEITKKAYFNLYKMYEELKNEELKNKYANLIKEKFPNTGYSLYVENPTGFLSAQSTPEALALYSNALELYQKENFKEALTQIDNQKSIYKGQAIEPKFALLKAYIIAKLDGKEAFVNELKKILFLYENAEERKKAKEIIDSLNKIVSPKTEKQPPIENTPQDQILPSNSTQNPFSLIN